jgi:hypothetical protein
VFPAVLEDVLGISNDSNDKGGHLTALCCCLDDPLQIVLLSQGCSCRCFSS